MCGVDLQSVTEAFLTVAKNCLPRLSVYAIEREALEAQDVPHITTSVWRAIGADEDEDLEPAGAGRSAETVYRRLASLSEEDLRARLALVENAIRGRFASTP